MKTTTYFSRFFLIIFLCFSTTLIANEMTSATVMPGQKIIRANWPAQYMGLNYEVETLTINDPNNHTITFDPSNYTFDPDNPPFTYIPSTNTWIINHSGIFNHNININTNGSTNSYTNTITTPCIRPDQNNDIQIELSYSIQDIGDLSTAPDIYLRYTVGNTTGILTESDMSQSSSPLAPLGRTFFKTVTIDFTNFTSDQFNYKFELLTTSASGGYTNYPTSSYPDLFITLGGIFQSFQTVLSGQKDLCNGTSPFTPNPLLEDNSSENIDYRTTKTNKSSNYKPSSEQLTIKAYPNPFTHQLILNGNMPDNSTIQLFDIQGKLILSQKSTIFDQDSPQIIDTTLLLSGIYYCKIQTSTSTQTIKVVKQ